jgi:hypothetical protein
LLLLFTRAAKFWEIRGFFVGINQTINLINLINQSIQSNNQIKSNKQIQYSTWSDSDP